MKPIAGNAEDLSIANARLKALIDIGLDLAAERDSERLLQRVCTAARDLFDATYVTLGILDPHHRTVQHFFTCGADAICASDATPWIKTGDTLSGMLRRVVDERRTMRGHNRGGDPATLQLPPLHPEVQAFVAAPIASRAHVYGWLSVVANDGRIFTADDDHLVAALSGQVGRIYELEQEMTARKQAELALGDSERRFAATFEQAGIGMALVSTTGNPVEANAAMRAMLGYTASELAGLSFDDFTHPEDLEADKALFRELVAGKRDAYHLEKRYIRKDRQELWGGLTVSLVRGPTGQPEYAVGMVEDITERKRAEELRQRQAAELQESQRIAGIGSWEWTIATGTVVWSEGMNHLLGRDRGLPAPTFATLSQFYTPESWQQLGVAIARTIDRGTPYELELEMIRADSTTCWTTTRGEAIHGTDGAVVELRGTVHDITERRRADAQLRSSEARYRQIVETAEEGIWAIDPNQTVTFANAKMADLLGCTVDDLIGARLSDFMDDEAQAVARLSVARREQGLAEQLEIRYRRKDGTFLWALVNANPMVSESGTYLGALAMVSDISERKRAEETRLQLEAQVRQAQKMESVGRLASGIAHDFNNLLTVINGTSDLLLAKVGADDPMHADLRDIFDAGERAALLTRQLLAFSRQQILAPQVVSLNILVAGLESLLRRLLGEDIDIVIALTPDVGSVKVDPGQIEQVIANLAVNGRDAMPQGGRLTIETQRVTIEEVDPHHQDDDAVPPGSYICLAVSDSGVGMDVATRAHIYEPFFTTKEPGKGTGLGLATVYGIVKQSQGFIRLQSEVGQGTSFKIFLPLVAEAACGDRPTPTPVSTSGTETILVVEDSAGLRKLVRRELEPAGYTVLGAASGEEALRLLQGHTQEVQLLVSDVVMPGMGGRHLAEQIAQTRPRMKVLYMSGYTSDTIVRHGVLEAEMPFLGKPFTAAELLRKVREVLDS